LTHRRPSLALAALAAGLLPLLCPAASAEDPAPLPLPAADPADDDLPEALPIRRPSEIRLFAQFAARGEELPFHFGLSVPAVEIDMKSADVQLGLRWSVYGKSVAEPNTFQYGLGADLRMYKAMPGPMSVEGLAYVEFYPGSGMAGMAGGSIRAQDESPGFGWWSEAGLDWYSPGHPAIASIAGPYRGIDAFIGAGPRFRFKAFDSTYTIDAGVWGHPIQGSISAGGNIALRF
jgi:hypothetical protein